MPNRFSKNSINRLVQNRSVVVALLEVINQNLELVSCQIKDLLIVNCSYWNNFKSKIAKITISIFSLYQGLHFIIAVMIV